MKHVKVNGQLRSLDKNWSHLKMKEKTWIYDKFREYYIKFLKENLRHPNKVECNEIVGGVFDLIEEKNIWIPYGEVKKAFMSKLSRYRKIELNVN